MATIGLATSSGDDQLVAAARAGDDAAFEVLYRRYHPPVTGYVHRMVGSPEHAEEIAQEAFISALRRLRDSDGQIAFKPWIYAIARNAAIDHVRSRSRRGTEVDLHTAEGAAGAASRFHRPAPTPHEVVEGRQAIAHLRGAIVGLSEAHHEIIVLRELEGLSYATIAERLGMSRGQVESTLFRARRRLEAEYFELASGERCERVQATMARTAPADAGRRDERRIERHLSHCRGCRRDARQNAAAPSRELVAA